MEQILKFLGPTFLSLKEFGFAYGIQGILLRRNFENYWLNECTTMSKYNIFHTSSNMLMTNVKDMIDIGLVTVPFGIAEIDKVKNSWNQSYFPPKSKAISHKIAKITTVYESDDTVGNIKDLFYKKQRERRSWWRKIAENPGFYHVSEIKKEKGKEYVEIAAQFPFGNILVETINFKSNAKRFIPGIENSSKLKIVEQVTSIDWACLAILCDGYIEIDGSKELHIHPKFSPYKAYAKAIIAPEDDETIQRDLNDLTLYIIQLLREEGIESIFMNDAKKPEVFQVPYIITVNNESLKSGLVKLVCQRTLCGETCHITDMAKRMYNLCYTCKHKID